MNIMVFSKEEAEEIKEQLLSQVDKLPNENKVQIKEYIKNLKEDQLEEFLKKNNIEVSEKGLEQTKNPETKKSAECIFCEIAKNSIPSYKIAENKKSMAILEINPLSKGHSIVIPTEHKTIDKMPKTAMSLAQKIAKKIKKKLKPEDIKIESSTLMGHAMINIIPIYKDVPLKKYQAEEDELKKLQKKLSTKKRAGRKEKPEKHETKAKESKDEDISKLPIVHFRIP